jgi:TonB family protein
MTIPIKWTFIILTLVLGPAISYAQNKPTKLKLKSHPEKNKQQPAEEKSGNFRIIESQEARFTGTDEELVLFFMENIHYDSLALRANAEGQVMISFTVNPDSSISNAVLVQKFGYNVDDQLIPIVSRLKFIPAQMNGVVIRSNHVISIPLRAYFH